MRACLVVSAFAVLAVAPLPAQQASAAPEFHGLTLGMTRAAFDQLVRRGGGTASCSALPDYDATTCEVRSLALAGDTARFSVVQVWFANAADGAISFMAGREGVPRSYFAGLKQDGVRRYGPASCQVEEAGQRCTWSRGTTTIRIMYGEGGAVVSFEDAAAAERVSRRVPSKP